MPITQRLHSHSKTPPSILFEIRRYTPSTPFSTHPELAITLGNPKHHLDLGLPSFLRPSYPLASLPPVSDTDPEECKGGYPIGGGGGCLQLGINVNKLGTSAYSRTC